jgi:hypothetical protein
VSLTFISSSCARPLNHLLPDLLLRKPDVMVDLEVLGGRAAEHRLERRGLLRSLSHGAAGAAATLLGGHVANGGDPPQVTPPLDLDDDGLLQPDRIRLVFPGEVGLSSALESNFDGL